MARYAGRHHGLRLTSLRSMANRSRGEARTGNPLRNQRRRSSRRPALKFLLLAAGLSFAASANERPRDAWSDYQIIMWQHRSSTQLAALARLGVTGTAAFISRTDPNSPLPEEELKKLQDSGLRYYIENIATDFYAPYHRWTPEHAITWLFEEAQRRYPDPSARIREPSLSDPIWIDRVRTRLKQVVQTNAANHPLYYSLGDETGIADLAAFWDFDFAPASLRAFREWLRGVYGTLDALNAEWDSSYARWEDVTPETTPEALARRDGNFARWADFKTFMDTAFARALRAGTDAVHAADPAALAAIEGAQKPGWGGYDYTKLVGAVDLMEMGDAADNAAIVGSLAPRVKLISTSFGYDDAARRATWQGLLRGGRGIILWDPDEQIVRPDGSLGPWGRAVAEDWAELRGGLGALLINSERQYDPVAILYSPESRRVQWLLDRQREGGDAWLHWSSEKEDLAADAARRATHRAAEALAHRGLIPRFVSPAMLGRGELGGARVLILPQTVALSVEEARVVRDLMASGGVVVAYGEPGEFDQHGRRRAKPILADAALARCGIEDPAAELELGAALQQAGVVPRYKLQMETGEEVRDSQTYVYRQGQDTIIAVQRDGGSIGTEQVVLLLPQVGRVHDVRGGRLLGVTDRVPLALDPIHPAIIRVQAPHPPG